jgi:hypothetical protein
MHRMEQTARVEHWICRRQAPRFRLDMPARLITLERHLTVEVEDLSESGARIALPVPHAFGVCVLRWMDFHAFAEVKWMRELVVGLQFASPISAETLAETCRRAPHVAGGFKQTPSPGGPARSVGQAGRCTIRGRCDAGTREGS